GFKVVNVPFRWERIQHIPGGALERDEINELKEIVMECSERGMKVILSMHNFGRFKMYGHEYIIGCPQVTREHYKAIWKEL
ncbi:cellulase family glycosylhydrolase, partial [Acinetobacter baumannii]